MLLLLFWGVGCPVTAHHAQLEKRLMAAKPPLFASHDANPASEIQSERC
jgi:hypothetical protein